jgi:sugar phosphate isomerase/epimerase
MKKIEFGFIQGRMISPPSKKTLQYFPKKNWRKEFEYAKKNNFDFIEYFGERKFNKENPIWNSKGLKEINILAKKNNLSNYSFCDDYFISNDLTIYNDFNKYFTKIINNLSVIGIKIYVLALFEKSHITKKNFRNFIKRLQNISDRLKEKKIKLALETNLDPQDINKLIKLINRKNVFIVYDTGNRLKKKTFQYEEIIKLKKHICHFHIKDKNWKGENVVLGDGNVKFKYIFNAIKHIKYKGKYTFETNRGDNPIRTMCNNKNFILKLMNKLYKQNNESK